MRLAGKTALVTGAAGGIGVAVRQRMVAEGALVLGVDSRDPGDRPESASWLQADVTDPLAMRRAVAVAATPTGRLDICVANAGINAHEDLLDGSPEGWLRVISVNLVGVMVTFQAAAARMVGQGAARLLATSSGAGLRGEPGSSAYCASKGGVNALVQALACELAEHKITVNAVAPGEIDTEMHRTAMIQRATADGRSAREIRDELVATAIPARRLGTPDEVAAVLAFLASDDAAYITGEVIRVDGGELLI